VPQGLDELLYERADSRVASRRGTGPLLGRCAQLDLPNDLLRVLLEKVGEHPLLAGRDRAGFDRQVEMSSRDPRDMRFFKERDGDERALASW
jgi:hypothetical protein